MNIKYQLNPIHPNDEQMNIEKTLYVIARCLSMSGFSINSQIYSQLLEEEKKLFRPQIHEKD